MPLYEYKCQVCGNIQTEVRKMSDRQHDTTCSLCQGVSLFKISTPLFTGSGTGWTGKIGDKHKSNVAIINENGYTKGKAY